MPSPTDDLINTYKAAQLRIIDEIVNAQTSGAIGTAQYKRAILANVNQILAELQGQSVAWVNANIPSEYRAGLEAANKAADAQYKAAGEVPPVYPSEFASIHQEALNVLIDDTNRTFTELIQYTGRNIDDMIAEANRAAIAQKLASGSTVKQAQAILIEMLTERGITAFEYKRGGQTVYMQLDRYAAMVARSTTAEVQNQASLRQSQEIAGDLVKMTSHSPTCAICFPLQGRVYSITGKTKGYPKLEVAYSGGYANIHPNCRHRVNPYVPALKSTEQISADQEYSNRPMSVDEMSRAEQAMYQEQLDRYNKTQKANTVLRNNRDQYQRYLARLGSDEAPKSFAGFMRMKSADGESWQNLQKQYRAIGSTKPAKVFEEFIPAKTIEEANKYAIEKLGFDFADYKGTDIRIANVWNEKITSALREFPELKDFMNSTGSTQGRYTRQLNRALEKVRESSLPDFYRGFGYSEDRIEKEILSKARKYATRTPANAYAYSAPSDFTGIFVNSKYKYNKLVDLLEKDVASGFHPIGTGTLDAIIDHEIAHQLDDIFRIKMDKELTEYYLSLGKKQTISSELSKYARTNKSEFIAEAWSEYRNNPQPREIAQTVGDMIVRIIAEARK